MEHEPIRVAHVIGKMLAGGVENVVFNYYKAIDKSKVQFDIYYDADSTVPPPQELIDMGANFYEIPPYQHIFAYLKTLRKCFKEKNYTIVHSHMNTLSVFPLFAARCAGVPVRIAHNHSVPGEGEPLRNALKYILRMGCKWFSTDYFACGEKAGRWMFSDKTFDEGKVKVINNAVDFARFAENTEATEMLKSELSLNGKFVIGHVGRFTFAKNHEFLLDIFAQIHKTNENAVLLLVGDGELKEEINAKAEKLGLSEYVIQTGKTTEPEKYYHLMNVFVMPSRFEGLPLTVIEAQVSGVGCVLSDVITKEAVISDCCEYMNLSEPPHMWAGKIDEISSKPFNLSGNSKNFDISCAAPKLTAWYMNKYNEINKR